MFIVKDFVTRFPSDFFIHREGFYSGKGEVLQNVLELDFLEKNNKCALNVFAIRDGCLQGLINC